MSRERHEYLCFITLCFLFMSVMVPPTYAQIDTSLQAEHTTGFFDADQVYLFAKHLWRLGEYRRAASEYERYLFSSDERYRSAASFQLGRSYARSMQYLKVIPALEEALRENTNSALRDSANVLRLSILLLTLEDKEATKSYPSLVDKAIDNLELQVLQPSYLRLKTLYYLRQGEWTQAQNVYGARNEKRSDGAELLALARQGEHLPTKSPVVAAGLSVFVPGAGKVYAGRLTDGIYSLILIASNVWLSYEGFQERGLDSFQGWTFGLVGAVFYVGNIYGSAVAVRLRNQQFRDELFGQINREILLSVQF